tara:strand:+ start:2639 stop:3640 length:1002 start_codon:yes stop_codon:yes gene_type:complete
MKDNNMNIKNSNKKDEIKVANSDKKIIKDKLNNIKNNDKSNLNNELVSESNFNQLFKEIIEKKSHLEEEIKNLEKEKNLLKKDIESTFSGQSNNIVKQVKGFQDYLTGALQNLSQAVEKLELVSEPIVVKPSPLDEIKSSSDEKEIIKIPALADTFKPDEEIIRSCFASFIKQPDFYAEPWKLRRSLDEKDVEIIEDWFFNMGGRGALESRGSRQKNVLISAGIISILGELYGDQFQTLILASEPERLGEWRRILQDSLGLQREDFGPNSGIVLFERPDGVIERADRLEENNEVPFIIVDASETSVEVPILQFPLWAAFAGSTEELYEDLDLD